MSSAAKLIKPISFIDKITGSLLGAIIGDMLGEQSENQDNPGVIMYFRQFARYSGQIELMLITTAHLIMFRQINQISLNLEYAVNANMTRQYNTQLKHILQSVLQHPTQLKIILNEPLNIQLLVHLIPVILFYQSPEKFQQQIIKCLFIDQEQIHEQSEFISCVLEYGLILHDCLNLSDVTDTSIMSILQKIINRNSCSILTKKLLLVKCKIIDHQYIDNYPKLQQLIKEIAPQTNPIDILVRLISVLIYNFKKRQWSPTNLLSIIVSLGGTTTLNTSLMGAILGALYGTHWFRNEWINKIENKEHVNQLIEHFSLIVNQRKSNYTDQKR